MDGNWFNPNAPLQARLPPSNAMAEQALLGALLANNKAYERVSEFLTPAHFADPIHGRIYQAIQRRMEAGQIADAVTLKAEFEHAGILEEVGGVAYLTQLLTAMVGIINAGDYARSIHDAWLRRQLIDIGEGVVNRAFVSDGTLGEGIQQLETAEQKLAELSNSTARATTSVTLSDALRSAIQSGEAIKKGEIGAYTPTGMRAVDDHTYGLFKGDLFVLGARPGMGKTSFASCVAIHTALGSPAIITPEGIVMRKATPPRPVVFFSQEMTREKLAAYMGSNLADVPVARILTGDISVAEGGRLVLAERKAAGAPLEIIDGAEQSLGGMRREVRRITRKYGQPPALVVVDFIQIMAPPPGMARGNRNDLIVSTNAYGLKKLAKDFEVPVLALSSLNREVEKSPDKRPTLAHLKESGDVEGAADAVGLLYRQIVYEEQGRPKFDAASGMTEEAFEAEREEFDRRLDLIRERAELIIAKLRIGRTGTIDLRFIGESSRFGDRYNERR